MEEKTKVQKLTTLEDKNCYNTPKTNVSEKSKSIPEGKISKLRNIFERKEDISKKGGVSSMKPSLAKEIANGSPAASKGKEENLGNLGNVPLTSLKERIEKPRRLALSDHLGL